jgi:hypothetical protein
LTGDAVPIESLNIGTRTKNALLAAGFENLGDLKGYDGDWLKFEAVGKKGEQEILAVLGKPSATEPQVTPATEPQVTPATEPQVTPATEPRNDQSPTILLIGAQAVKGFQNTVTLEEITAVLARDVEEKLGTAYYSLGNFFQARDLMAGRLHELAESLVVGRTVIVTNTSGPVTGALLDVLIPIADFVVRGHN